MSSTLPWQRGSHIGFQEERHDFEFFTQQTERSAKSECKKRISITFFLNIHIVLRAYSQTTNRKRETEDR